jgi:hypothetical protein
MIPTACAGVAHRGGVRVTAKRKYQSGDIDDVEGSTPKPICQGEKKTEFAGRVASKPDDKPIIGRPDTLPECSQTGFDLPIVMELRPPSCPRCGVIRIDRAATQIVGPTQHLIVSPSTPNSLDYQASG